MRRAPLVVFAFVEVVALVTWLIVGRSGWFYIDEWDFIAGRKAGDLGDLFRSHNGHWTTLPVLVFRFLYWTFGLRTYLPYRAVVIVLYLIAAALLLAVMRRADVQPWIATAAASLFALFGAGWENIILPFQITFMGSLVFGLVALLLADHDGDIGGRDWLALGSGLFSLMCSGVGPVMVVVVGAATLARRGWQVALSYLTLLAGCYVVWLVTIGGDDGTLTRFKAGTVTRFVGTGVQATFGALGPIGAFGILFAVALGAGLALVPGQRRRREDLVTLAAPGALLLGALVLLVITAVNRTEFGAEWARQSRYVSLVAAMTLPALAVAADALTRRWRWFLPFAVALFLVGIPANIRSARDQQRAPRIRDAATRATMLSLPHDPFARRVPRSVRPEPTSAAEVTIGWLLDAQDHGKLPAPGRLTPDLQASNRFRLSFARAIGAVPDTNCHATSGSIVVDLRRGDRIGLHDAVAFLEPASTALIGPPLPYKPANGAVTVLRDAGATRFTAIADGRIRVCVEPT